MAVCITAWYPIALTHFNEDEYWTLLAPPVSLNCYIAVCESWEGSHTAVFFARTHTRRRKDSATRPPLLISSYITMLYMGGRIFLAYVFDHSSTTLPPLLHTWNSPSTIIAVSSSAVIGVCQHIVPCRNNSLYLAFSCREVNTPIRSRGRVCVLLDPISLWKSIVQWLHGKVVSLPIPPDYR